ncbi:MAG: FixH family protein [Thiobacillus sp.]|nr:FixH family protein [Thiobacillus sp.]
MKTLTEPTRKPWYREPWPWFLMSLPATAVVAGIATVWIAFTNYDGLVVGDYYKAGLAINQTLARDDAARALGLAATLRTRDGALNVALTGKPNAWPEQLTLTLAHPTHQGQDRTVILHHAGNGTYRAAMPALHPGKWHAQLTDSGATWRLAGGVRAPFDQPASLRASPLHQPQGD